MIIAGYFEDDASDELTNDSVFKAFLEKDALASQPRLTKKQESCSHLWALRSLSKTEKGNYQLWQRSQ